MIKNTKNNKGIKVLKKTLSIAKIILLTLDSIAEGITQGPGAPFFPEKYAKKYGYTWKYKTYHSSLVHLKKRGLIKKENSIYKLTTQGEKEAFFALLERVGHISNENHGKWDGNWRIIFFDIPEKKRRYRDSLRRMLKTVGFKEFQKSTWIYPYKVPAYLKEILFDERIKHHTRLITTKEIEYDADLKRKFKI